MLSMPNIQPGKGKKSRISSPQTARPGNRIGTKIAIVFKAAFFIAVFAGIINSYIFLNQKIVETDRKIAAGNKEIHQIDREIERLRIHRETFRSWRHISKMMAVFNLDLRMPQSGQICKLTVLSVEQAAMVPFAYTPPRQVTAQTVPVQTVRQQPVQTEVRPRTPQRAAVSSRPAVQPRRSTVNRVRRTREVRRPVRPPARRETAQTRNGYPLFDAR